MLRDRPTRLPFWKDKITLAVFLGLLFDFCILGLSIVDAYSDFAVALEFRDSGRTGFFYACAIAFVLGMISDSFAWTATYDGSGRSFMNGFQFVGCVVLLTPFAHILPIVNYFVANRDETFNNFTLNNATDWDKALDEDHSFREYVERHYGSSNNVDDLTDESSSFASPPASEEILSQHKTSRRSFIAQVDEAALRRQRTLMLVNVQCMVESLPQSIIQLIAISLTQQPTPTQIFSLSLSLVSIATKAFQLCRSWSVVGFAGKLLFIVHDLFSLAFLSGALFLSSVPAETTFLFGSFDVTYLTWWWLWIKVISAVVCVTAAVLMFINDLARNSQASRKKKFESIFTFTCFFTLGFIPATILQEGFKLTYLFIVAKMQEPDPRYFPNIPLLHHFLWETGSSLLSSVGKDEESKQNKSESNLFVETTDWKATFEKLRAELFTMIAKRSPRVGFSYHFLEAKDKKPFSQRMQECRTAKMQDECADQENEANAAVQPQRDGFLLRARYCFLCKLFRNITDIVTSAYNYDESNEQIARKLRSPETNFSAMQRRLLAAENGGLSVFSPFLLREVLPDRLCFDFSKQLSYDPTLTLWEKLTQANEYGTNFIVSFVVLVLAPLVCAATAIFGLLFPILHYFWYSEKYWTQMQYVTFYSAMTALALAVPLAPGCVRYVLTSMVAQASQNVFRDSIAQVIDVFHSVPISMVRTLAVRDPSIVPARALDRHVLAFLDAKMVGLYKMGIGEHKVLMNMIASSSSEGEGERENKKNKKKK